MGPLPLMATARSRNLSLQRRLQPIVPRSWFPILLIPPRDIPRQTKATGGNAANLPAVNNSPVSPLYGGYPGNRHRFHNNQLTCGSV